MHGVDEGMGMHGVDAEITERGGTTAEDVINFETYRAIIFAGSEISTVVVSVVVGAINHISIETTRVKWAFCQKNIDV